MIHVNDRDFPSNLLKDLSIRLFFVSKDHFLLFFLVSGVKVFGFVFCVSTLFVNVLNTFLDRGGRHSSFDMVAC